jgi:hypothetical protein
MSVKLGLSPTLREERRLRVFEYMVLRRIFGPKRDEVTGEWRKLHNEELTGVSNRAIEYNSNYPEAGYPKRQLSGSA